LKMRQSTVENRHYIGNFYIEKNKLKDNLLSIKYSKTEAPLSQLRPRSISAALRGLIEDVIDDNYNEKVYNMLEDDDKRTFKKIVKVLKLPIDTYDDLDKEYQKNYELSKRNQHVANKHLLIWRNIQATLAAAYLHNQHVTNNNMLK